MDASAGAGRRITPRIHLHGGELLIGGLQGNIQTVLSSGNGDRIAAVAQVAEDNAGRLTGQDQTVEPVDVGLYPGAGGGQVNVDAGELLAGGGVRDRATEGNVGLGHHR